MFESSRTYGLFTAYFDAELYHYAISCYDNKTFGRSRPIFSILGVTQILEDIEVSQRNRQPYQNMKRFIEQDFCQIYTDDTPIINRFQRFITARIDLKLFSTAGNFQILSVSDNKADISKPTWFQRDGIGYVITSYVGKLEFVAKASVNGEIRFYLKSLDIRNTKENNKSVPYWIDYVTLIINGQTIFDTITPAWHDKPYLYSINVKADEKVSVQVEWLPHRSDT